MSSFKIGSETIKIQPMPTEETKERITFEKTLATTPEYKTFRTRGETHPNAINLTMKAKGIIPKYPFKDKAGNEIKWFSLTRLPPNLKKTSEKYWKWNKMVRGERLISYNDSNLRPLTMAEKKERVAFSRTIMQTPEYKEYLKKGYPRSIAIEKTAVNIQKNTKGNW